MYVLKTVAERYERKEFHPLDLERLIPSLVNFGSYQGHSTAHEIADYVAGLELVKTRLIEAGYQNPSLSEYYDRSGSVCVLVDEDDRMYKMFSNLLRPSVTEVCLHTGMGMGCGNGYCTQLFSYNVFRDMGGPDETHGRRSWTNAPCPICFPAEYAKRKAAGEIWNWPERGRSSSK